MIKLLLPIDEPLEKRKPHYSLMNKDFKINVNINSKIDNVQNINIKKQLNGLNDPKNIKIDWSDIIGYEYIKKIIDQVLINKNDKKTHVLIVGHAGTSKTVFLKTIEKSLTTLNYNVHYLDSTTLSSSGVIDYLFNHDNVEYLLLDELDKLEKEHQACFLNLLETGILQETKWKKIRKKDMKNTITIATGNYIDKIMNPLKTRFMVLNIPKYTKNQFYEIAIKLLVTKYGKTDKIAFYIVDQIWKIYTEKRQEDPNMRQAVQVASITDNDKHTIDQILKGLELYSLKTEVE